MNTKAILDEWEQEFYANFSSADLDKPPRELREALTRYLQEKTKPAKAAVPEFGEAMERDMKQQMRKMIESAKEAGISKEEMKKHISETYDNPPDHMDLLADLIEEDKEEEK